MYKNLFNHRNPSIQDGDSLSKKELIMIALVLIASRVIALKSFPVFDDAFITFRYGKNLAEGNFFLYNIGEWILGTTSPLFGLISALIIRLGGAPETLIPVLNICLDVVLLFLAQRFLFRQQKIGFIIFWLFFCISPMLARICVGAMEADLFVVFTFIALAMYSVNRSRLAVLIAASSYFLRPEGVLTVAVLCAWELFGKRRLFGSLLLGGIALATVAPALITMQYVYGGFVPQSVIAKSHHVPLPARVVLEQLLAPEPVSALFALIGVLSLFVVAKRGVMQGLMVIWFVLYVTAYALAGPKIWSWYSFAPLVFAATFAAQGISLLLSRWQAPMNTAFTRFALPVFSVVIIAAWTGISATHPDHITSNLYKKVENFCQQRVVAGDTILAGDIGVIGYYCPNFIYDTAGLVWPAAFQYKSDWEMIAVLKPGYLMINVGKTNLNKMAESPLNSQYQPVIRLAADGEVNPARTDNNATDSWAQEYILYKRME